MPPPLPPFFLHLGLVMVACSRRPYARFLALVGLDACGSAPVGDGSAPLLLPRPSAPPSNPSPQAWANGAISGQGLRFRGKVKVV